jgi:hypothetical protein
MLELEVRQVLKDYVNSYSSVDRVIRDVQELPHSKEKIRTAILQFAKSHPHLIEGTIPLLLNLSCYQQNVARRDAAELLETIQLELEAAKAKANELRYRPVK